MFVESVWAPVVSGLALAGAFYLLNWISPLHRARRAVLRDSSLLACVKDKGVKADWQAEIDENARYIRRYENEKMSFYYWGRGLYSASLLGVLLCILFGSVFPVKAKIADWAIIVLIIAGIGFMVGTIILSKHPETQKKLNEYFQEIDKNVESDDTTWGVGENHSEAES